MLNLYRSPEKPLKRKLTYSEDGEEDEESDKEYVKYNTVTAYFLTSTMCSTGPKEEVDATPPPPSSPVTHSPAPKGTPSKKQKIASYVKSSYYAFAILTGSFQKEDPRWCDHRKSD